MTALLDANVLIALIVTDHAHHDAAEGWFADSDEVFATCPVTQGSLVRFLIREGYGAADATAVLATLVADLRHQFLADTVGYPDVRMTGVVGHRQVTDAYLAQLARAHNARLITFDQGLAQQHTDVTELIPTIPQQPR